MKIITRDSSFDSVRLLLFYIVMNSLIRVNQVKASVTVGSVGANSNGEYYLYYFHEAECLRS